MGFYLLPLVMLGFFLGAIAVERQHAQDLVPTARASLASSSGQTFVAYRNAVAGYKNTNAAFTGTVTAAMLTSAGYKFSTAFLATVSNQITATGLGGFIITCYGALEPGALMAARTFTESDASLGISTGSSSWVGGIDGGTLLSLSTPVPTGNVVSVIQIGS